MQETSRNGLHLIKIAMGKLKGHWCKGLLATFLYVFPLVALCAIPYAGWCISIALFGYLTLGYINYMQQLLKDENPSLKVLYVQPEFAQAIVLGIIMCVGTLVGSVLFIIPGILMIAYYSLSLFVLNEEKIVNVSDTLNVTAKKMRGNKMGMFAYKVIYYLFYALIAIVTAVLLLFIYRLYVSQAALAIVLGILTVLVAICAIAVVTLCMYAATVIFYDEIVRPVEIEEVKVETKVEEAPVEETQPVEAQPVEEVKEEKPVAKKPAAKKTTTSKTTATKSTAAKSTTKKSTTTKKTTTKKAE